MKSVRAAKAFNNRYPYVGPIFWAVSIQYYLIQLIVASAWEPPYSWLHNTISDLGNTACGQYGSGYVCSPHHALMNASFITLGVTMILGSILIYHEFEKNLASAVGFSLMAIAGIGSILVGLFPENTISWLHVLGASMPFLIGNLGLVTMGIKLDLSKKMRYYTVISGTIALIALVLFVTHHYLGLGIGGMERLTAYPQTMWLTVFGLYISMNHWKSD